jgi:hypothetical protein
LVSVLQPYPDKSVNLGTSTEDVNNVPKKTRVDAAALIVYNYPQACGTGVGLLCQDIFAG